MLVVVQLCELNIIELYTLGGSEKPFISIKLLKKNNETKIRHEKLSQNAKDSNRGEEMEGKEAAKRRAGMRVIGVSGGDPRMSRIKTTNKDIRKPLS